MNTTDNQYSVDVRPMTGFQSGARVRLESMSMDESEAQRLREMGLREGMQLAIIQNAQNLIVGVIAGRIGLRRDLARKILASNVSR